MAVARRCVRCRHVPPRSRRGGWWRPGRDRRSEWCGRGRNGPDRRACSRRGPRHIASTRLDAAVWRVRLGGGPAAPGCRQVANGDPAGGERREIEMYEAGAPGRSARGGRLDQGLVPRHRIAAAAHGRQHRSRRVAGPHELVRGRQGVPRAEVSGGVRAGRCTWRGGRGGMRGRGGVRAAALRCAAALHGKGRARRRSRTFRWRVSRGARCAGRFRRAPRRGAGPRSRSASGRATVRVAGRAAPAVRPARGAAS